MAILFAANWKMHHGPEETTEYARAFMDLTFPEPDRDIWFFPPAISIAALVDAVRDRPDIRVGSQDVHWEPSGAFTGALSIPMLQGIGATCALVGHSERRHVFRETDEETGLKVAALSAAGMVPMLCVGELLEEREQDKTVAVIHRQLRAGLAGLSAAALAGVVIAYEPVWAIGTGRNATGEDAATVHAVIREWMLERGGPEDVRILYGGSVKPGNALSLLSEDEIDGVLVGGASLTSDGWAELVGLGGSLG